VRLSSASSWFGPTRTFETEGARVIELRGEPGSSPPLGSTAIAATSTITRNVETDLDLRIVERLPVTFESDGACPHCQPSVRTCSLRNYHPRFDGLFLTQSL
jgi:hypothetical protein